MSEHGFAATAAAGPVVDAVGQRAPRADGREKLSGKAQFTGDIRVPGMLYAAVLRSPFARARLGSVDASAAELRPGVRAVLTGADLRDMNPYYGHALRDRPILALDTVRFAGEPVAVVAAETQEIAEEALTFIDVSYEPLPVIATLEAALAPGAEQVHTTAAKPGLAHGLGKLPDLDGNICYSYGFDFGDVAAAFGEADLVVEGEYRFPAVYQYAME
ncbi:MAG: xanthine dehydrogenase family protein molybdopterin-binding subunit, partial [Candidatus Dormiibacterota bacterium]